jgi:hypothetical protein
MHDEQHDKKLLSLMLAAGLALKLKARCALYFQTTQS